MDHKSHPQHNTKTLIKQTWTSKFGISELINSLFYSMGL